MAKKRKKSTVEVHSPELNKVITVDGKVIDSPEEARVKKAISVLGASMTNLTPLTGKIIGTEKLQGSDPVAVMNIEGFKVVVPMAQCIDTAAVERETNRDPEKYALYLLQKRMGSEIDVVIRGYNADKMVAIADRKLAMAKKRQNYFFGVDANGDFLLQEGQNVEARVVCSTRPGIIVEIFGVEVFIMAKDLSYQRVQDCSKRFLVGSKIVVRIMSLDRYDDGTVNMSVSAKEAMVNPYLKAMERYNVDDKYIGTVSMVDKSGVFVSLDSGVDVLCALPQKGPRPPRGTEVTVRITMKQKDEDRLFGLITHVARIGE